MLERPSLLVQSSCSVETVCEQILEENEVSGQTYLWRETNAKINTAVNEKPGPSVRLECAGRAVSGERLGRQAGGMQRVLVLRRSSGGLPR